jgi:hypothetical protein
MSRKKFSVRDVFKEEETKEESRKVRIPESKVVGKPEGEKVGKGKRSFSISQEVLDDLKVLAWYLDKPDSQVAEEALKRYVENNAEILEKAKEIKRAK